MTVKHCVNDIANLMRAAGINVFLSEAVGHVEGFAKYGTAFFFIFLGLSNMILK